MLFWIAAGLITIACLALILSPLMRKRAAGGTEEAVEVALYRSQLAAIEDEERAGRIFGAEAEATRTEVKRRMLATLRQRGGPTAADKQAPAPRRYRALFLLVGAGVPLIALAVYLSGGSPGLPDQPFAKRGAERAAAGLPTEEELALVRELETRLAKNGSDARGWVLLGGSYIRQQRFDEAAAAFAKANELKPGDADVLASLGEAMVLQNGGEISEPARAQFEAALKANPAHIRARYFVGLAKAQASDFDGAVAMWSALLADAPKDAPWRPQVEAELAQARAAQTQTAPGTVAQLDPALAQAAAGMTPQQRAAMISGMVERLADRLRQSPHDLDGWLRLARSYGVLGETDKAKAALDQATEEFHGDAVALEKIAAARKALPAAPQN